MSTLDVLNAISEAREALIRVPELESTIKSLTEERDFIKLERDEAELTIQRLKARITELEAQALVDQQTIKDQVGVITDLTLRNNYLDESHRNLTVAHTNALDTINEKNTTIQVLRLDKAALEARLEDAKSFSARLTDTLKGIGQSIVAAVEVPEVAPEKPFPVSDTVGLSDPADFGMVGERKLMVDPIMAEPADADLVNEDHKKADEPADGCFPYRYW